LFRKGGATLFFEKVEDAICYELDSHYWRSVYASKFPGLTFQTVSSSSELEESSEDDVVKDTIIEESNTAEAEEIEAEEDFDLSDFQMNKFEPGAILDVFDLPETTVSVHVGTRIEVSKKAFKKMIINSQLQILQNMVRDIFSRFVKVYEEFTTQGNLYHALMFCSRYCHDILARGYESYDGFDVISFAMPSKMSDTQRENLSLRLQRFKCTMMVYAVSSSFCDKMKKELTSSKRDFYEMCQEILSQFVIDSSLSEEDCETYRLSNLSVRRKPIL